MEERIMCDRCNRHLAITDDEEAHNTGECGCKGSRALCWRKWTAYDECRTLSPYDPDFCRYNVIELVKSLSVGPCSCQYNMGSFIMTYDNQTGKHEHFGDRGPRTQECMRCRARTALDADAVRYVKDDTVRWTPLNSPLNVACAAPVTIGHEVTISFTSGSSLLKKL